mmetsp:Transcript_28450/g.83677  ORF Transcript_28450/g.83677 Transcript_28450/m.83677 type:complete len:210 (+) Transcript_28450:1483-2112(+)
MAPSEVETISADAAFHSGSGTASFSRTSTWAWWMERPTTWTWRPLDAAARRSSRVLLVGSWVISSRAASVSCVATNSGLVLAADAAAEEEAADGDRTVNDAGANAEGAAAVEKAAAVDASARAAARVVDPNFISFCSSILFLFCILYSILSLSLSLSLNLKILYIYMLSAMIQSSGLRFYIFVGFLSLVDERGRGREEGAKGEGERLDG